MVVSLVVDGVIGGSTSMNRPHPPAGGDRVGEVRSSPSIGSKCSMMGCGRGEVWMTSPPIPLPDAGRGCLSSGAAAGGQGRSAATRHPSPKEGGDGGEVRPLPFYSVN